MLLVVVVVDVISSSSSSSTCCCHGQKSLTIPYASKRGAIILVIEVYEVEYF